MSRVFFLNFDLLLHKSCMFDLKIEIYAKKQLFLNQLYANIAAENKHSINLFKKHKFIQTGKKVKWNFYDENFHDEYIFQKII